MRTVPHPIRVFLVSDFALVLWGLEHLLATKPDRFTLAGSADNLGEAMRSPALSSAQLIVIDMETEGALEEVLPRLLARTELHVLLLTRHNDLDRQDAVVLAGAHGVLRKTSSPDRKSVV